MSKKSETNGTAERIPSHLRKSNAGNTVTGSGRTKSASSPSAAKHDMHPRPSNAVQPSSISVKIDIGCININMPAVFLAFFVIISPIFLKYDPPPAIQAIGEHSALTRQGDGGVSVNCLWDCNIYVNSPQQAPPRAATNAVRPQ